MIISIMEEWPGWAWRINNLVTFVRIQGPCSGEKVRLVLMMLGVCVCVGGGDDGSLPWGRTHIQLHDPQYKYFISITILPHQKLQ